MSDKPIFFDSFAHHQLFQSSSPTDAGYNRASTRMRLARRIVVSGRVQGVGFRFFTQAAAVREGLHGWVRNLPDGRVEISAEGEAEALQRFEHKVRHGPPGARVEDLEVADTGATGSDTGFHIR